MGLFRKKKKPQYVEEILEFGEAIDRRSEKRANKAKKNAKAKQAPKEGQSQENNQGQEQKKSIAAEYCEQILAAAKNLDETKREYKVVTDYLTDIQTIEDLPEAELEKIQDTAQNVLNLNEARDAYLNKSKTISDAQFAQMEPLERDMQYLEGEREEWRYYQDSLEQEEKVLRKLLYGLIGLFAVSVVAIVILGIVMKFDIKMPFVISSLVAGAAGAAMAWRLQNDGMEIRKAQANINRAIVLLNKVKFKYVNVTNAVDYACEKYHVKNAYELTYIWDQYLEAVKEREKYQRTNDDLDYFNDKLIRQLRRYRLYDAKIWIYQAKALLDKKEMVEVKHELLVRRQKLRGGIESQVEDVRAARTEIENMVKNRPEASKEIKAILDSLDEVCGLA